MPFGIHETAATFQRLLDSILNPYEDYDLVYLDIIIIYNKTWEDNLVCLKEVLIHFQQVGLCLNPQKSKSRFY